MDDGDGCGFLERLCPGGVLPALLVGVGELLGVGVGERSCDVDGEGDGVFERAGAEPEARPERKLLEEPGAGPPAECPLPDVP